MSNNFRVGDLIRVLSPSLYNEGGMGLIIGIDFNPRLHDFPMYVIDMLATGNRLFLHPMDIEGVSLTDRDSRRQSTTKGDNIE